MRFPTLEDIVKLNQQHLKAAGHLKERGSLEWVLDAIQHPVFGVDRYPTLVEKAAKLAWVIIHGHVFWDGNKRTGMSVLYTFLRWNGYRLNATNEETVEIALRVAEAHAGGGYAYEEFVQWVRDRIVIDT